ncbi:uncharacterized protein LOC119440736 [Dermacentor silvarum]|uniref:uncharacterized protein LOC119440736 n=1 Tax=Dermacentor silvarum TaxID=543639 RepID=UPI00189A3B09|nr:uncharacterized protein LOC119440736 [Dermacentor silvarum]
MVALHADKPKQSAEQRGSGLLFDSRILIDTPGCIVRLNRHLFSDFAPSTHSSLPVCVGREPPVSFNLDRAFLDYARLDNTYGIHSFRDVSCHYAGLVTDSNASASDHRRRPFEKDWYNITTGMKLEAEYFKLRCLHKLDLIYSGLHLIARRRYRPTAAKVAVKPSVLVVSIGDSSRNNFERNFRDTASFLRHSLNAHELFGYSAVGTGSFSSAAALLGGMTAGEAWSRSSGSSYDALPLLWNDYKKRGHWTVYIEETPSEGAFVDPVDRGFLRKPTDYYPVAMASQMSLPDEAARSLVPEVGISNEQPSICSGYRLRSKALLDYASELIRAGDRYPFFAFINLKDSSRGGAKARALDRPLKTFLANLERQGAFAETTLILLSDIGKSHWDTGITRDGSDMPFCFVKLPPFLIERFVSAP